MPPTWTAWRFVLPLFLSLFFLFLSFSHLLLKSDLLLWKVIISIWKYSHSNLFGMKWFRGKFFKIISSSYSHAKLVLRILGFFKPFTVIKWLSPKKRLWFNLYYSCFYSSWCFLITKKINPSLLLTYSLPFCFNVVSHDEGQKTHLRTRNC